MNNPAYWELPGNNGLISLLTPEQLPHIPRGSVVHSISGERLIVGRDRIDGDTRAGYLAYGLKAERVE